MRGLVNVFEKFEGNQFIFDVIPQGSIINVNNFLAEDMSRVTYKCETFVEIAYITRQQLESYCERDTNIKRYYEVEQLRVIYQDAYPLDYTLNAYEILRKQLKNEMIKYQLKKLNKNSKNHAK